MIKNKERLKYYGYYSLLFTLICLVIFSYFYLNNKTFISHGDGISQHYKVMVYISAYLKQIFKGLFTEHKLIIPNWDFCLGEGADVLATLQCHGLTDPFYFFVGLFPERYIYAYYDAVVILKMYLSGLFFVELCLYAGKRNLYSILSGSLIYVFCYWLMLNATKHMSFLMTMMYMPLVILGVEKIIKEDKPACFIWSVFFCSITMFYFFYMIVLLTVVYVAIRALTLYKTDVRKMVSLVWKLLVNALLALGLSAAVFVPTLYAMYGSKRIGLDYALHLFYDRFYYERLFTVLLADDYPEWLSMGFASPVILSLILSFKNASKSPFVLWINVACIVFMVFPIFGKIFNGMGYVVNRWSFVIALVAAYTFVCEYEDFQENRRFLLFAVPLFILFGLFSAWSRTIRVIVPCGIALFYTASLFIRSKYRELILIGLIIVNICFNADHIYSKRGDDQRALSSISVEEAQNVVKSNEAYELKQYLENNNINGHIKYSGSSLSDNVSMLNGLAGTNLYFSLANPNLSSMRYKLAVNEYSMYRFYSLDQRGTLLSLANVHYYMTPAGYDGILPYGYDYLTTLNDYDVYEDRNALPFGYTYDKAMSYTEWDKLDPVAKQEAMLEAVIIDGGTDIVAPASKELQYVFEHGSDLQIDENIIRTSADDVSLTLKFDADLPGEYYLLVDGLDYWDGVNYFDVTQSDVELEVRTDAYEREIEYHTNEYEFYNGRHDYVSYLGYYENGLKELELEFSNVGEYRFDKISVIRADKTDHSSKLSKLSEKSPSAISFGTDEIDCEISLSKEKYMLLSVPYAEGWKAFVDDKETVIYRANECYMALFLPAGTHSVRLCYETPYLKLGACLSIVSLVVYIGSTMMKKKKKRN